MNPNFSTNPEVMQTMDASCADFTLPLGKRKAETLSPTNSVDDGCENDAEEIEEKGSSESDQVWGFDSFDGSDYESPDSEPEDSAELEFRRYGRHYHKTKGFNLDEGMVPKGLTQGSLRPLNLEKYFISPNLNGRQYMEISANVAIHKYNQTENKTLTLDHIVRASVRMRAGVKSYITFMAKEGGELVEYQAKTERKSSQKNIHAIFCRPAPKD